MCKAKHLFTPVADYDTYADCLVYVCRYCFIKVCVCKCVCECVCKCVCECVCARVYACVCVSKSKDRI